MSSGTSVSDRYLAKIEAMKKEVINEPDNSSRLSDRQQYEDDLFQSYARPEVNLSGDATTEPFSKKEQVNDGWDRLVPVTVHYLIIRQPVTPADKRIPEILNCSPATYPDVDFEYKQGYLQQVIKAGDWDKEEKDRRVKFFIDKMRDRVETCKLETITGNKQLKDEISKIVTLKMKDAEKNRRIQEKLKG